MKRFSWRAALLGLVIGLLLSCNLVTSQPEQLIPSLTVQAAQDTPTPEFTPSPEAPQATPTRAATDTPVKPTQPTPAPATPTSQPARFAVIGDYGTGNQAEHDVADLVKSWNPDFIITVGDNNYPEGSAQSIDFNIGQFYHEFIYPYKGFYGTGAEQNRFFPSLGNHDWMTDDGQPYFDYFTLPGNERYYDFTWGPLHFFAVDSDSHEPDGVGSSSIQAQWLKDGLAASTSIWNVVFFHHPPYSSGMHGPVNWMRWPFVEWGADVLLAGHDHLYERLDVGGIPLFINGLGGGPIYRFVNIEPGSQARYNDNYGAMLVTADAQQMVFRFFNRLGEMIDDLRITK
jgi:tartrate-resistant acid phosphatase type 5